MKGGILITSMFRQTRRDGLRSFLRSQMLVLAFVSCFINLSCENSSDLKPKANSLPVIMSVKILPETPCYQSELNAIVQCQDPDNDPVTFRYQWMRNGEEIPVENKNILGGNSFKKGEFIQVRVTPSDGKAEGKSFLSDPMKILNSPPVIQEMRIEPMAASANDDLRVLLKSFDPDGDSVNYTFQWEKNGTIVSEKTKDLLEKGQFKKGDSIAVVVTPDDGESTGIPRKAGPILITNSPPIIVSIPEKMDGDIYTYQVKANDPDNDPITFRLKTAPKGMEIDRETGLIRWRIQKEDKGGQLIEIEASDTEGAKSIQRFTLSTGVR